jgi:hypothetical protein
MRRDRALDVTGAGDVAVLGAEQRVGGSRRLVEVGGTAAACHPAPVAGYAAGRAGQRRLCGALSFNGVAFLAGANGA